MPTMGEKKGYITLSAFCLLGVQGEPCHIGHFQMAIISRISQFWNLMNFCDILSINGHLIIHH